MSLLSRLQSFFHKRQERQQEEIVISVMPFVKLSDPAPNASTIDNDLLLKFFRNEEDERIPHRHEDIVCFTDEMIEYCHDYIQWIFPTFKPSSANPDAPTIDYDFADKLCKDECARKNYCKSCRRFLNYMNFDCDGDCNIVDSTRDVLFYELPAHNYLRFTRVLDSLNQRGRRECSKALYEKMFEVMNRHRNAWQIITRAESVEYWRRTQLRRSRRIIFLDLDGVMDNCKYDVFLNKHYLPEKDEFGVLFDPDCIAALRHVVGETGAEIVISSSWKDDMSLDTLKQMWKSRRLPGHLIDVTPTISQHRGDEIAAWLTLCPDNCQYIIIDDLPAEQFHTDQYPHLFTTSNWDGLTMELAEKAIEF